MKKFLFALIVSLLVTATSYAEIQTFTGTDEYTVGETETQADAKERSRLRALRNAQEQAGVLIKSRSRMKDLELVDDEVVTIAAAVLKVVGAPDYKVRVLDDGKSTLIVTTVTVQIDTDDVDRRLKTIEARENPKPPVDRPKPIEQPAPQPVEEPKPEKVEPPTEKIEQPAEHGIKIFESKVRYNSRIPKGCEEQFLKASARQYVYRKANKFTVNYCLKKNYKMPPQIINSFVREHLRIVNVTYNRNSKSAKVTGTLDLNELNAWLEKF